jgi:energy-coupling factor transporter ATP-binding protein EcfA2
VLAIVKIREREGLAPYHQIRESARQRWFRENLGGEAEATTATTYQNSSDSFALTTTTEAGDLNISNFLDEVTGIAILGNSGSGKTALAKYIAGYLGDRQILVLDPHADPTHSEYAWEGLTVINNMTAIVGQLKLLLGLLDCRDKTPLTIICDEWPAIRLFSKRFKDSAADDFLLRYGSEARKFNKLPIFLSQSGNVKALGMEGMGDFLENFALLRLGKVARKFTRNLPDQHINERLKSIAYPLLIGEEIFTHPTHGEYEEVRKGQPPLNLGRLTSLPLTIPLITSFHCDNTASAHGIPRNSSQPTSQASQGTSQDYHSDLPVITASIISCPHCQSDNVRKNGSYQGKSRYQCRGCKKTFYEH